MFLRKGHIRVGGVTFIMETNKNGNSKENVKRISVSKKRQMTIPKEFYDALHIDGEVNCEIIEDAIVIKPIHKGYDFSEEILADLIKEGFEGNALLKEFTYRKSQLNPALHRMIEETRDNKSYSNIDDFFDELEDR